jgi:hypothetical protein
VKVGALTGGEFDDLRDASRDRRGRNQKLIAGRWWNNVVHNHSTMIRNADATLMTWIVRTFGSMV